MANIIFLQPANHSCRWMEWNSGYGRNLNFTPKYATKFCLTLENNLWDSGRGKEKSN